MPYKDRQQQLAYQRDWNARQKRQDQQQPSLATFAREVRQLDTLAHRVLEQAERLTARPIQPIPYYTLAVARLWQAITEDTRQLWQLAGELDARTTSLAQIARGLTRCAHTALGVVPDIACSSMRPLWSRMRVMFWEWDVTEKASLIHLEPQRSLPGEGVTRYEIVHPTIHTSNAAGTGSV